MFWYGTNETICTKHKTLKAAKQHAKSCEAIGGAKHHFIEVRYYK